MRPLPDDAAVALIRMGFLLQRRTLTLKLLAALTLLGLLFLAFDLWQLRYSRYDATLPYVKSARDWSRRTEKHPAPASDQVTLPTGQVKPLRRIQHDFSADAHNAAHEMQTAERRQAVRDTMAKCWASYKEHAWGADELAPVSLEPRQSYGGWGATLVDSLDTLIIMGMHAEFREAAIRAAQIDWDATSQKTISLFETNIRFLGGLMSAYELSGDKALLRKAVELGWMLYAAFDTPGRLPTNDFEVEKAWTGDLEPKYVEVTAAVGTLSMEFAKLAMLTGEQKFYSAIDRMKRAFNETQDATMLPGMWPTELDFSEGEMKIHHDSFSLGPNSDSMYEYLSKTYMLLGGLDDTYETMHIKAMDAALKEVVFRPMTPDMADILFAGSVTAKPVGLKNEQHATLSHLSCFVGGMYLISGKVFDRADHGEAGEKLALGCPWAYNAYPLGIMPEDSILIPCNDSAICDWDQQLWIDRGGKGDGASPQGFLGTPGLHYLLRPEAIESLFIMFRITGKKELRDVAWKMFEKVRKSAETEGAFSSIKDVTVKSRPELTNSMESFWMGETLKYLYLIFSDPNIISLDEWVFNTEAHPFKLPKAGSTLLDQRVRGL